LYLKASNIGISCRLSLQSIEGGFAKVFEQQPNGKGAKDATLNFNSQYEATSPVWTSVHGFVPVKRVSPTNKN
jgi:hypothetical protein